MINYEKGWSSLISMASYFNGRLEILNSLFLEIFSPNALIFYSKNFFDLLSKNLGSKNYIFQEILIHNVSFEQYNEYLINLSDTLFLIIGYEGNISII